MRRRNTIEIRRRATLWAIYELTKDGLDLICKKVSFSGKPECEVRQIAVPIAKGHVVFTMAYDDFVNNAIKSEFIKEDNINAD